LMGSKSSLDFSNSISFSSIEARGSCFEEAIPTRFVQIKLSQKGRVPPTYRRGGELISAEIGTSVNRLESGRVPPATHVALRGDEAGQSNQPPQGVPYPYHPEQVIRGDSILSIEHQIFSGQTTPSSLDIYLARINVEDLFEAKVKILQRMAKLDSTGD
nr:hypothetical protein [Tanacetum cinerariifolium]